MKGLMTFICLTFVCLTACGAERMKPSDQLVAVLIQVESVGKDNAIGDLNLRNRAYGPLQVRQPVCDDVNRHYGTHYRAQQCLGNRALSIEIFRKYMDIYATLNMLGREPSQQDYARIWNGGPDGYRHANTEKYWKKVIQHGLQETILPVEQPVQIAHQKKQPHKTLSGSMIAEIK